MNDAEACFGCCIKNKTYWNRGDRLPLVKDYTGEFDQTIQQHTTQLLELTQKLDQQSLLISSQQQQLAQLPKVITRQVLQQVLLLDLSEQKGAPRLNTTFMKSFMSPVSEDQTIEIQSEETSPQGGNQKMALEVLKSQTSFKQETKELINSQIGQNDIKEKVIVLENQVAQQAKTIESLMQKLKELEEAKVEEKQSVTQYNTEVMLQKESQQSQETAQLEKKIKALEEQITTGLSQMNEVIQKLDSDIKLRLVITEYQAQMEIYLKIIQGGLRRIGVLEGKK